MNKVKFPKLPQRKPALGELNEGLFGAYLLVDSEVALSWFPLQPIPPKVSTKIPNQNCSLTRHCCKLGLSLESSIRGRRYFLRSSISIKMVLQNDIDWLHPSAELEKRKHKIKRLVQTPNSFFMNHCVQSLANSCGVWELPDCAVPAYWWSCQTHRDRGFLFQEEWGLIVLPIPFLTHVSLCESRHFEGSSRGRKEMGAAVVIVQLSRFGFRYLILLGSLWT
ncbi:hypothetical protein ACFX13_036308 [Malus domestica]